MNEGDRPILLPTIYRLNPEANLQCPLGASLRICCFAVALANLEDGDRGKIFSVELSQACATSFFFLQIAWSAFIAEQ